MNRSLSSETPNVASDAADFLNIEGFIRTLSAAPSYVPKKLSEQIVVVVSGGNMSLYIYDVTNLLWRQGTLV